MKTTQLTVSDPQYLAEFIMPDEMKAFFEKRFEVPPDHVGLLMRNGQFVQSYKGAHFTVGGVFQQIKGIIGGSTSVSLMIADLKTFQQFYKVVARTKDKVDIDGEVVLDLQVNPEKPQNILGMMEGRRSLSKADAALRLKSHAWERVFEAAISRVNANEVRGNKGLQDLIQADLMKECERIAGDLGLMVRAASVSWALNEVEKAEYTRAAAERETAKLEFDFENLKRDLEREHLTTAMKMNFKTGVDKLEVENEDDLKRLVLSNEIEFTDARETGARIAEMKVLEHEINKLKVERLAKFAGEIQQATHDGVDLKIIDERRRLIERNTEQLDRSHQLALRGLERDYDRETRELQRDERRDDREYDREGRVLQRQEDRGNRLEDREDEKVRRKEDRDYDYETRDRNLGIQGKERDFGFDGRKKEVDVADKEQYAQIARQRELDKAARDKIKDLQGLEMDIERDRLDRKIKEADAAHDRDMDQRKLEAQREADRLVLGAKMTPEQILAVNAGLSPAVAKILEEQAKAQGVDKNAQMDLMRQMVEQANRQAVRSEEQARAMFNSGMQGAVGVAAGAGGKGGGAAKAEGDKADTVECPKCTRVNPAKAKFCVGCGEQLRK
jgi:nucleotidyltransferase/DNA polymerase involved in DNA repair